MFSFNIDATLSIFILFAANFPNVSLFDDSCEFENSSGRAS